MAVLIAVVVDGSVDIADFQNATFTVASIVPVLPVGNPAGLFQKRLDATFLNRVPVAVKRIARQAHHLTRLRHVAECFRQIEKADLTLDDFLGTL